MKGSRKVKEWVRRVFNGHIMCWKDAARSQKRSGGSWKVIKRVEMDLECHTSQKGSGKTSQGLGRSWKVVVP